MKNYDKDDLYDIIKEIPALQSLNLSTKSYIIYSF